MKNTNQEKSSVVMNARLMGAIWRPILHQRCTMLLPATVFRWRSSCLWQLLCGLCIPPSTASVYVSLKPERVVPVRVVRMLKASK